MIAFAPAAPASGRDGRPPDAATAQSVSGPGTSAHGLGREERAKRLDDGIARIGAHLDAALYRQLVMIREFDQLEGWHLQAFRSCAAWLSWRIGLAPGAARERVRVARALEPLPVLSDAFRRGRLSYSAARALTRIATPENEAELVEVARHTTAAQLEKLVRGWRMLDRAEEETGERERHEQRKVSLVPDACGSWVMGARFDPEVGAEGSRALEWAEAILRARGVLDGDATATQRRADAFALVIEAALGDGLGALADGVADPCGRDGKPDVEAEEPDGGSAKPDGRGRKRRRGLSRAGRCQVVVHVSAETLRKPGEGEGDGAGDARRLAGDARRPPAPVTSLADESRIEGGPRVSAETARRLSCDAGIVVMTHDREGNVLDVGRRTRSLPTPIRRALDHRDGCCRFPGCTSRPRVCDGHHIHHWMDGGETKLDNLALLCRWHHRRVHEDGWRMELRENGEARFYRPDGRRLPEVPPRPEMGEDPAGTLEREGRHLAIDEWTATTRWIGDPLDVDWALFTLQRPRVEVASESDGSEPGVSAETSPARSRGDVAGARPGGVPARTRSGIGGATTAGARSSACEAP